METQTRTTCNECSYDHIKDTGAVTLCPLHGAAERLLEAMEAVDAVIDFSEPDDGCFYCQPNPDALNAAKEQARAAIKEARGE